MLSGPSAEINAARRAEYMANLDLTAKLEDRVLQAVKLNKRTGQTMTPITDMRSLDEKMMDTEKLKAQVRHDLLTITDAPNMSAIMQQLTVRDVQFVAQRFHLLAAEIRPKFQLGIDAQQFMVFLRAYADRAPLVAGAPAGQVDVAAVGQAVADVAQGIQANEHARQADYVRQHRARAPEAPRRRTLADVQADANQLGIETHEVGRRGGQGRAYPMRELQQMIDDTMQQRGVEHQVAHAPAREIVFSPGNPQHGRFGSAKKGYGIQGRGIHREPLGRYTICARKLGDDIVQIRSARGGAVHRFPTEKVSGPIAAALRKVVAGGTLGFEDIEGLNEDERRYLHRVANGCDLLDRCPVPAPKKDAAQIEMDLFTKLRGEACAGNNNPELIRDLKRLLFKMKTEGTLPASQVNRVLLDLLSLGV